MWDVHPGKNPIRLYPCKDATREGSTDAKYAGNNCVSNSAEDGSMVDEVHRVEAEGADGGESAAETYADHEREVAVG